MLRGAVTTAAFILLAAPALADAGRLFDAIGMPRIIEVMREEGLSYGETIRTDLLAGQGGAGWSATVSAIYDARVMDDRMRQDFTDRLEGLDLTPLLDFFESDRGQRIVESEVAARRAFLDEGVEEAAGAALVDLRSDDPERYGRLEAFVAANDLVESNVMGAMNSNYAFYQGLMAGEAFDNTLTEEQVLSDIWSQEESIRSETEVWVYSFLGLAYAGLSDADIDAYVDLSLTEAGRALNRALFGSFNEMFTEVSRRLGEGAAQVLIGQDI
jgi:hypothetical protein